MEIRDERPEDHAQVREVEEAAFGRAAEADLVEALRGEPGVVSLVMVEGGVVLGHLLLTPVDVEGDAPWDASAVGPMAVRPERQRWGVGAALVRAAIDRARAAGAPALFVLGHRTYYPRFGFRPAAEHGLRCVWPVPDDLFMVLELSDGALAARSGGVVRYAPAFEQVG